MAGKPDTIGGAQKGAGAMRSTSSGADDHRMRMSDMGILPQLPQNGHSPTPIELISDDIAKLEDVSRPRRDFQQSPKVSFLSFICRSQMNDTFRTLKTLWIQRLSTDDRGKLSFVSQSVTFKIHHGLSQILSDESHRDRLTDTALKQGINLKKPP